MRVNGQDNVLSLVEVRCLAANMPWPCLERRMAEYDEAVSAGGTGLLRPLHILLQSSERFQRNGFLALTACRLCWSSSQFLRKREAAKLGSN